MNKTIDNRFLSSLIIIYAIALPAANALDATCDVTLERQNVTVQVTAGSVEKKEETIVFQPSCTTKMETIEACAVINVTEDSIQTFCFPEDGTPAYTENYVTLEYYGSRQ